MIRTKDFARRRLLQPRNRDVDDASVESHEGKKGGRTGCHAASALSSRLTLQAPTSDGFHMVSPPETGLLSLGTRRFLRFRDLNESGWRFDSNV